MAGRAKSDVHYALAKPIRSFHTEVVVCRVQDPIKSGDIGSIILYRILGTDLLHI